MHVSILFVCNLSWFLVIRDTSHETIRLQLDQRVPRIHAISYLFLAKQEQGSFKRIRFNTIGARKTIRIQVYSLSYRFQVITLIPITPTSRPSSSAAAVLHKSKISSKSLFFSRDPIFVFLKNSLLKTLFLGYL